MLTAALPTSSGLEPPLVSVITPCRNAGRFLEAVIKSVVDQTYPRTEHVVIDGASTDGSVEILKRFPHLRWLSEPDDGQADAVNKGIRLAAGKILGWLNADDAYGPDAIATAVRYLEAHPDVDLVYGVCRVVDAGGALLHVTTSGPPDLHRLLTADRSIPLPAVFFRRRVVDRVGLLDPALHLAMDFDYWVRVGRRCRLAYVPAIQGVLRVHAGTKSVRRHREVLPETLATLERAWADHTAPPLPGRLRREAIAGAHVAAAIRAYLREDRALARRLAATGLARFPHPLRARTGKALLILADALLGTSLFAAARAAWQRAGGRRAAPAGETGRLPRRRGPESRRSG